MTGEDAKAWIAAKYPVAMVERLGRFADKLIAGSRAQNLIAASTIDTLWSRHLVDSAQLLDLAPSNWRHWIDIGSGAGLPGIVVAILADRPVTLIEPRRLRVEFLTDCVQALGLPHVSIVQSKAETASAIPIASVISARAVAPLDKIFQASTAFANRSTTFVLPKGISADIEVAVARSSWHGTFHVEQSIVDPTSGIVVATGLAPR